MATSMAALAGRLEEILSLDSHPVAVFLPGDEASASAFSEWRRLAGHRYCQGLMRARRGESVVIEPKELACPAAASAFGFRDLPEQLANGRGLVGFGIVGEAETGRAMFEGMSRLRAGSVREVALCPLAAAPRVPDVVVVEAMPESLMWLALADLNLAGGARRRGDTAVLQATCVDATVIPLTERRLNFSLGCYGCREATDITPAETVVGFPGALLGPLTTEVERLSTHAVKRSRDKVALHHINSAKPEKEKTDGSVKE